MPSGRRSRGTRTGESSCAPMRQADGRTRDTSPRQLPTDHDYDGELHARSANIRLINRRQRFLGRRPLGIMPTTLSTQQARGTGLGSSHAGRSLTKKFFQRVRPKGTWASSGLGGQGTLSTSKKSISKSHSKPRNPEHCAGDALRDT